MWMIVLIITYVSALLSFRSLGGFAAAGEAFKQWGRIASRIDYA